MSRAFNSIEVVNEQSFHVNCPMIDLQVLSKKKAALCAAIRIQLIISALVILNLTIELAEC